MAELHFACNADEVPVDAAKIVRIKNLSVGIFKLSDGFHALLNICPHRGGALCEGPICGTTKNTDDREFVYDRAGELVRCAWHGWEFDIRSGEFLVDPAVKARTLPVSVKRNEVFVHL